jgi:acyl-CoA dehydrogenase
MPLPADEFETFLARVRAFTRDHLIPAERQVEEADAVPENIVAGMREHSLFGLTIPPEYGGLGLGMEQQVLTTMEFTQASSVFRARFSTTLGLGSQAILHNASEDQKRTYLPRLASGEWTAAFALTEPEAGSDAGNVQTLAIRQDGDYVLNGHKRYITNAPEADLFVVMARTDPDSTDHRGVSAFLVEAGAPGLTVLPPDRKLGQHGSHIAEMRFKDCRVPVENLIGGTEGIGFKCAMDGINVARMHVAATCVGQALRLIDEALAYAMEREQFGQPIAEFQAIQFMLADSRAETLAARAMTLETARRIDAGERPLGDMSCCKYFASEMVCRVADRAVQILGGAGYTTAFDVERLYRDVRLFRIFEGTSQIHQLIIAREMMKQAGAAKG